jgi:tetratricopeptide (TPR) repeat protein
LPAAPVTVVVPLTGDAAALLRALPTLVERWPADVPAELRVAVGALDPRAERLLEALDAGQIVRAPGPGFGELCAAVAGSTPGRLVVVDHDALPSAQALSALLRGGGAVVAGEHCLALDAGLLAAFPVLTAALDLRALAALSVAVAAPPRPPPARPLLSAALIVRDEQRALPACLASLVDAVDEIVVCDTGSTDRTREVAAALGARVVHAVWEDDFSAARNVALAACRGDWVLSIDADEQLRLHEGTSLRRLVERADVEALGLRLLSHTDRMGSGGYEHDALRLFRRGDLHWVGAVHETLRSRRTGQPPLAGRAVGLHLDHDGYTSAIFLQRDKARRNLALAEKDHASAAAGTGRELWKAAYELARALSAAGGPADRQQELLREALAALPPVGVEHVRVGASVRLARLLLAENRCEEAADIAARATAAVPSSLPARLVLAEALAGLHRPADALAALDAPLPDEPATGASRDAADVEVTLPRLRAQLLAQLGRPQDAVDAWTSLVAHRPAAVDWPALARALRALGDDWPDRLAALADRDPAPLVAALPALRDPDGVRAALRRRGTDPDAWSADALLARDAAPLLEGADPEALAAAAATLEQENPAMALAVWRSAPLSARSQVGAARCLVALDRLGEALDSLDGLEPEQLEPADLLTVVLLAEHAGDHDSARALLRLLPQLEGDLARTAQDVSARLPC